MTFRLNRQVRGACTAFVLISTSILYTENAHSGVGVDGVVYTSVGIDNRGSTDVYVAAIYRVRGWDVWHTKAWWKVKPGLLNGVKIESGTTSERFYLAFLMKNDKGELVYLKNLKIRSLQKDLVERIDRKFCVRREGELTARNSSFSDLSNCPSGYELAPFILKLSPSTYKGSIYPSDLVLFVYPDKSSVATQATEEPATSSVERYRKAAEQGDAAAQNNLGVMYQRGEGVAKDLAEAVKWYRKAAEQGLVVAQYNLAAMYTNGWGVAKDDSEVVKWYRKAAEQGHADAQNNLGAMYQRGEGVAEDLAEAVKWYRKAAEQGGAVAQFNLGVMYANGWGVAKDDNEAVKWYQKAAEQGHTGAKEALVQRWR